MTTTISAAQGTSTAAPSTETETTPHPKLVAQLKAELGNRSLERLEQECRDFIQATAYAILELGKRLLILKEIAGHGNWLLTLQRIGINAKSAACVMRATLRILSLPDHERLVTAAKSKSKLFELMVLDDDELQSLNQGESVRGVSLRTLPNNSVATLRAMLRDNAPKEATHLGASADQSAPVAPPTADALVGETQAEQPLQAGDRVESLHAGRAGKVVSTYADGSACVCWDDGMPQPEGLGHERMPRQLLVLINRAQAKTSTVETGETGATTAPFSGRIDPGKGWSTAKNESAAPAENIEDLPSVFSMVAGEFVGMNITLLLHSGKVWMIAEEIAAVMAQTPEERTQIDTLIAEHFDKKNSRGSYAKVRFASLPVAVNILDTEAIHLLDVVLDNPASNALAAWMREISAPGNAEAPAAEARLESPMNTGPTLAQRFEQLGNMHHLVWDMLDSVANQIRALRFLADDNSRSNKSIDLGRIAEIAEDQIADYNELTEDMSSVFDEIKERVFQLPEPGMVMPESVWLKLVTELSVKRDSLSGVDMVMLADLATELRGYAPGSPEVAEALTTLRAFTERNGARLYDYQPSGRVAFEWMAGRAPNKHREASLQH
jgi:hypothetical protein